MPRHDFATSAVDAVADIADGAVLAVGGFGICGTPLELLDALLATGARELHVVANNCGVDGLGLGRLLTERRIRKVTCSFIGQNREFGRQVLDGSLELDLVPQGTLAERMRAGGTGIGAFYTPTGAGTAVAEGGLPRRYGPDGTPVEVTGAKEVRDFGGVPHVLEYPIKADVALVHAHRGDRAGNLTYRLTARNFNPVAAMCAALTIAEVEVPVEALDPDEVHTPGIFVSRVVATTGSAKPIEIITNRPLTGAGHAVGP
jgi:3-oxoacid CoA-transferase subunit A